MKGRVDSVIKIPTDLDNFFKYWLEFLKPFHKLTSREMDVAIALLKKRHELSKVITDENILNKVLLSDDTRRAIREELDLTIAYFQVIMGKLKKHKVLIDGRLNHKFIPNITEDNGNFQLLLLFDIK